jgi:hypothetical protein
MMMMMMMDFLVLSTVLVDAKGSQSGVYLYQAV